MPARWRNCLHDGTSDLVLVQFSRRTRGVDPSESVTLALLFEERGKMRGGEIERKSEKWQNEWKLRRRTLGERHPRTETRTRRRDAPQGRGNRGPPRRAATRDTRHVGVAV